MRSNNMCVKPQNQKYLRPKKAEALNNYLMSFSEMSIDCDAVEQYENATIIPVRTDGASLSNYGGVISEKGEYVESSVVPGWVTGWYDDFEAAVSNSVAVYCGRMIGQWGHFLVETVTRLWFFLENDRDDYIYVFIVKENSEAPVEGNFRQFFDLLGIGDRVVFLNKAIKYAKVIVPCRSFQYKRFYSYKYVKIFDRVIENALHKVPSVTLSDAVYLSRGHFEQAQKQEAGLQMLDNYFAKNGFSIIYPEEITLVDLIHLLKNARICASESGTAAHNFLFSSKKIKTVILERRTTVNYAQASIDHVRQLDTVYVDSVMSLEPVSEPCFLYYTSYMHRFTKQFDYIQPDDSYLSVEFLKKALLFYKSSYDKMCVKQKPKFKYSDIDMSCMNEAICETHETLKELNVENLLL